MTNQEFSDTFTTLLNSYNTQAQFGEQASRREIVLDEYEKSVLLTQAQDIIVKSYFDGTLNPQGQGFDDSTRRQVDFSSLIKVANLTPEDSVEANHFDERGLVFKMPRKSNDSNATDVLFILNEKLIVTVTDDTSEYWWKGSNIQNGPYTDTFAKTLYKNGVSGTKCTGIADAEANNWRYVPSYKAGSKEYVIVPINYKEYDREMSKPYAQPLKKQAWRLFQNKSTSFDVNTELIPKHTVPADNISRIIYRIRYIRRPCPIVLESMPNGLEIDGVSEETSCELNPILHMDILNKAVELAIATRGGAIPQPQQARAQ